MTCLCVHSPLRHYFVHHVSFGSLGHHSPTIQNFQHSLCIDRCSIADTVIETSGFHNLIKISDFRRSVVETTYSSPAVCYGTQNYEILY